ncbi:MAG: TonB-dependent receptor [Polyangiaceae bacterium]|nr:TonB-dependent receptor [Polyangiaceae bacterium]
MLVRALRSAPFLAFAAATLAPRAATAQDGAPQDAPPPAAPPAPPAAPPAPPAPPPAPPAPHAPPEVTVTVEGRPTDRGATPGRAGSRVGRRDMEERLPRSAPDALRYEPGVFVQQSAHGQGSPFIRGRTGQQTVMLFDGIRMNTSLYRQGPNQYFFTLDARTIQRIEVTRGGASTRYGSDAIGGALDARPIEPALDLEAPGVRVRPRASLRYGTADSDFGHRFQVDAQISPDARAIVGAGIRRAGRLESGGPVRSPRTGAIPQVPAFEEDGRTQLGTGFRELTADGRAVLGLGGGRRLVAAAYAYRQYDSPRTDQCPPPFAPRDECLSYDEQFRSLAYLSFEGDMGALGRFGRAALSYQRQHERRSFDRPQSFIRNLGRDDVDTLGITVTIDSEEEALAPWAKGRVSYGGDGFVDLVRSKAWTEFTDIETVIELSRGQYLDGARYAHGGAFVEGEISLGERVFLRAGGRGAFARASAQGDAASGSQAVDGAWPIAVGHAGAEVRVTEALSVLGSVDRSYRAPNLDDLTSRQQSGPGFQFENPELGPEAAITGEIGVRWTDRWVEADVWGFHAAVHDAIARAPRTIGDCPPETPQCATSWSRFQLVNVSGAAQITGLEASARTRLPLGLTARATLAYAYGRMANPQARPQDPALPYEEQVPISRIPPLNGTAELRWGGHAGLYLGAGLRWALLQDRLAPTDRSDARIPEGGTPGFAVLDLRAGYRIRRELLVAGVLENVTDAPYRIHGSSVNGPGRGVIIQLEAGL